MMNGCNSKTSMGMMHCTFNEGNRDMEEVYAQPLLDTYSKDGLERSPIESSIITLTYMKLSRMFFLFSSIL